MKSKEELKDRDMENVSGGATDGLEKHMWIGGGAGVHTASSVTEKEARAIENMNDKVQEKYDEWLNGNPEA